MDIPIYSYKVEKEIEVKEEQKPLIIANTECIIIDVIKNMSNEEKYIREVEYKIRQEFNDYLYEHFYKFNREVDWYTKERLWKSFRYEKKNSFNMIEYILDKWDAFEDKYL